MRTRVGFRTRTALTIAAFSLLLLIAQSVAVVLLTYEQEDSLIDQILSDELHRLERQVRQGQPPQLPASERFYGYLTRSPTERSQLPAFLRDLPPGTVEIEHAGRVFHIAVKPLGEASLYLVYDATLHEARVREFSLLMALAVLSMAVVAALLGYGVAGILVRQVTDLARRVTQLRPGDDAGPSAADYLDEEMASLAKAISDYHRHAAELIRREKEFTAYVSHELRTPLTALKTGCELLAQEPSLSSKARARVDALAGAAARMEGSIQALLFLARGNAIRDVETVNVRETVEEVLASLQEALRVRPDLRVEIDIDVSAAVRTNRTALEITVTNLLKNAIAHTHRGHIRLRYDAPMLEVSDTGTGIAKADLPHIFERFYRGGNAVGGEHTGLGLAIVRSIADQLGWRIDVQSKLGEGTRFCILFPPASVSVPAASSL